MVEREKRRLQKRKNKIGEEGEVGEGRGFRESRMGGEEGGGAEGCPENFPLTSSLLAELSRIIM